MEAKAAAVVALPGEVVVDREGDLLWGLAELLVVTNGYGENKEGAKKKCEDGEEHFSI